MSGSVTLKRGETLALEFAFAQDDGTPIDTSSGTITGSICDALGVTVATPTFAALPALGAYTIGAGSTAAWPVGMLSCSVTLTMNGVETIADALTIGVTS